MRVRLICIAAFLIGAAILAPAACLLPEIGIAETDTKEDAGSDAEVEDTGSDAPLVCAHTSYPDPPSTGDGASIEPIVVALRSIYMGDGVKGVPGYDLDYKCTCLNGEGDSCKPAGSDPICDDDGITVEGGVDNSAATLFKLVQKGVGTAYFGSTYFSNGAKAGEWSILVQLSDYNGDANDPFVTVTLFVSPGLEPGVEPLWDGNDAWPISDDSLKDPADITQPLYVSEGAYVSEGVVVATLPSFPLRVSGGQNTISVRIQGGLLTGRLVFDADGTKLTEGVIAGRWAEPDVFAAISSFRGQGDSVICNDGDTDYVLAKITICGARDILTNPVLPASSPCDALSIGIGFEAWPAKLGMILPAAMQTPGCTPETDPANDSCEK